jgi:hypothetical protein
VSDMQMGFFAYFQVRDTKMVMVVALIMTNMENLKESDRLSPDIEVGYIEGSKVMVRSIDDLLSRNFHMDCRVCSQVHPIGKEILESLLLVAEGHLKAVRAMNSLPHVVNMN